MTGTTQQNMLMTPRDVEGRFSISTMTEDYIEILSDKPEQRQAEAQTDFLLNKPAQEVKRLVTNADQMKTVATQIVEED